MQTNSPLNRADRRHFELKGETAEQFLQSLANKTFLTDWCYPNAKHPNGKEICDLLVVFDDIAIIWQIKDIKLRADGQYSKSEVQKNIRQLVGARRTLFELDEPITLSNPRRGNETFDSRHITSVYLIAAFMGEPEDHYPLVSEVKGHTVHIFTREFCQTLLAEGDTISDFTHYLKEKERLLSQSQLGRKILVQGGEEELLAIYIKYSRSLASLENSFITTIDSGHWAALQAHPDFRARNDINAANHLWDDLIDDAHTSADPEYEEAVRKMARFNRFERRVLSQFMLEAWHGANEARRNGSTILMRTTAIRDTTICFMFADEGFVSREDRQARLLAQCFIARGNPAFITNKQVLGIASEILSDGPGMYDIVYLDHPDWTEADTATSNELKRTMGIGNNITEREIRASEYPLRGT